MKVTVTVKVCSFFPKWKVTQQVRLYIFLGRVLWQTMMSLRFLWLYARIPSLGKALESPPPQSPGSQAVARAQFQVPRLCKASEDIYYLLISRVCAWQTPGFCVSTLKHFYVSRFVSVKMVSWASFPAYWGNTTFSTINKDKHLHSWGLESWGLRTRQI